MEKKDALDALQALAQETRLDVFRLLVAAEPDGMFAGDIAQTLDVKQNTLSSNLAILERAQLVSSTREGRSIRYRAHMAGMADILTFLMKDCCGGSPDACKTSLDAVFCSC